MKIFDAGFGGERSFETPAHSEQNTAAMTCDILGFLPPEVKLVHTRYGLMICPAGDFYIGRCLEIYGEYCPEEGNTFRQLVKPGDVVVEAGANIGSHTVLLSNLVGPDGQVHAFEPQRLVFQMLCANLALNSIGNVRAHHQGLGSSRDVMRVSPPPPGSVANFGGIRLGRDGHEAVDIVQLDSLHLPRLNLLKIDVEGMEEAVVRGGVETILRLRPKLYLENDSGQREPEVSASLIRLIRGLGYRLWWHVAPIYVPNNFRNHPENIFPSNVVSINMLCIRDDEVVDTNFDEILHDTDVARL